jgi:hypothetical protein
MKAAVQSREVLMAHPARPITDGWGTVAKANDLPMQDTNLVKDVEK